jgi:Protein of unknown function (DUF3108)
MRIEGPMRFHSRGRLIDDGFRSGSISRVFDTRDLARGVFRRSPFQWIPAITVVVWLGMQVSATLSADMPPLSEPPFKNGERLVYDISWAGLTVGEGVLESEPLEALNGREMLRVRSTATSNGLLSLIFPVRDRIESDMDAQGLYPYRITLDQRHGFRRRHKVIEFDQEDHKAVLFSKGKTRRFDIPPQVQDILSSLYYFRAMEHMEDGSSVFINVHDSKKNWRLEIQILGRETLTSVLGTLPTVKAKALIRYEGVLLNKGDLTLWLTDDPRHVPVMMNGKVAIGSITAMLTKMEPGRILQGALGGEGK